MYYVVALNILWVTYKLMDVFECFHLNCSIYIGNLLKQNNFCSTKKCILTAVVMWEGCAEVGKESLIEQTNE